MIKILDNAIPEDVRNNLVHDPEYRSMQRQNYFWWPLKFFDFPRTPIQTALHYIWKDHINFDEFKDGGIEWWINKDNVVNGKNEYPDHVWHPDVHEPNGKTFHKFQSGILGNTYYPHSNCIGGFFEIVENKQFNEWGPCQKFIRGIDHSIDVERIKSKTNRSIFFEPYRVHRVSKIYNGTRDSVASTLWKKKPLTFNEKE
jgi:hypothetical protein